MSQRLSMLLLIGVAACQPRATRDVQRVDEGVPPASDATPSTPTTARVTLGFNAKGTVDSTTQVRVVDEAFAGHAPLAAKWTIRITGGTRSQTDKPSDWSDAQLDSWIGLQKKYGFSFIYVVNGNDAPESQAQFVRRWIARGARFAFLELMNEYYLQKFRNGDTSFDEVTRKVTAEDYVNAVLPAYLPALRPIGLPFFVILAPDRQEGAAAANMEAWNRTVITALTSTYGADRFGVTLHFYLKPGDTFDYDQIDRIRARLPEETPIAITEAGVTDTSDPAVKVPLTSKHLGAIVDHLKPGDYLCEQILYKPNDAGLEGTLTPQGVTAKGKAVFDLYRERTR